MATLETVLALPEHLVELELVAVEKGIARSPPLTHIGNHRAVEFPNIRQFYESVKRNNLPFPALIGQASRGWAKRFSPDAAPRGRDSGPLHPSRRACGKLTWMVYDGPMKCLARETLNTAWDARRHLRVHLPH